MPDIPFQDPFEWFTHWYDDVLRADIPEPTAMTLATVNPDGQPTARIVLLKDFNRKGFVFYTNTLSRKGRELSLNPKAGLNFFWPQICRQVRVEGHVEMVTPQEADTYFATRPRLSQIGAWCSQQSQALSSKEKFLEAIQEHELKWQDSSVPRPPHWSGYRVIPTRIEFWHAGDYRLHDRWEFVRSDAHASWTVQRLYP